MAANNSQVQHVVTAVIVAHDGAAWLPHAAEALLHQTRPVQRVVAVDTGSQDRSGSILTSLIGRASVFGMDRTTGYGMAVTKALLHRAASTHVPGPAGMAPSDRIEWIWLLHDDCEPEPAALEQLLLAARQLPGAAVLGPKVMDWSDRSVILEAGVTIDRGSRRVTGLEPREVDQGQHDGDRDVLAVSSAGMLIRRDVWDEVGGFDPGMALFREDVDFCWRVQAAGYRVRVVTDAIVYHVEASARNRRPTSAAPRPLLADRRNALLTLFGNLPAGPLLGALAGNILLSLLRTAFFLLAKRPRAALDEFTALFSVLGHPLALAAARRERAPGRRAAYGRVRAQLPAAGSFQRLAEFLTSAVSKSGPADTVGSHHATDDPSDDDSLLTDTGVVQRLLTSPAVLLFLALTAVTLVAERSILGTSPLGGGALIPAWGGASALWQEYLQAFHPAGIGSAASTPPYVAVVAALATILGGKPWLAIDVILLGCVPLAGLGAFRASRRVTSFLPARVWAAAAYALLPVGMGAVAAGRIGTALVFALVPVLALLAGRIFTLPRRRARRAAWATGLVLAIATAFTPLIWVIAVILAAASVLAVGWARRAVAANVGIVVGVPAVLLLPWTLQVATHPALLALEAGVQQPGLASADLPARSLLLLSPGGPGLPPFWVTAGIALAALAALVLGRRRTLVSTGWCVALAGLLAAVLVSRMVVTAPGGGPAVTAWPGAALAVAAAGLLIAALAAADSMPGRLARGRWRAVPGLAVLVLAALACSAPLLAAASWVTTGISGPVRLISSPVLPEFVTVSSDTGLRLRTLVLRSTSSGLAYGVLRGSDPLVGEPQLTGSAPAQRALQLSVAALTAPAGSDAQDQGAALAQFGIGYVLMPAPVNQGLARAIDGVAGLRPVSKTSAFELWRVVDVVARLRVIEPGGRVAVVPSGPVSVSGVRAPSAGGTLVLAEPAGGWHATLNGQPLTPLAAPVDGWAQGFRLPPGGGTLSIGRNELGHDAVMALEGIALLVIVGLALPGSRVAAEAGDGGVVGAAGRRSAQARAGRGAAGRGGAESDRQVDDGAGGDDAGDDDAGDDDRASAGRAGAGRDGTGDDRPASDRPGGDRVRPDRGGRLRGRGARPSRRKGHVPRSRSSRADDRLVVPDDGPTSRGELTSRGGPAGRGELSRDQAGRRPASQVPAGGRSAEPGQGRGGGPRRPPAGVPVAQGRDAGPSGAIPYGSGRAGSGPPGPGRPGTGPYPAGRGAYPPGNGAYPPGNGAYPPGRGAYPPGSAAGRPGERAAGSGGYPQGPGAPPGRGVDLPGRGYPDERSGGRSQADPSQRRAWGGRNRRQPDGRRRPSSGYPGEGYPGPGYPGAGYPEGTYPADDYPAGGYPPGGYPAGGYPAGGYPAGDPRGYPGEGPARSSGKRQHVPRGRLPGDDATMPPRPRRSGGRDEYGAEGSPAGGYSPEGYPPPSMPRRDRDTEPGDEPGGAGW